MNDFVIGLCGEQIHERVDQREHREGDERAENEQLRIGEHEHLQELQEDREGKRRVHARRHEREEKLQHETFSQNFTTLTI